MNLLLTSAVDLVLVLAVDDDQVTPGVIGFVITAVLVAACILLMFDMVRRMRRVRYREEARARIAAESANPPAAEDTGAPGTADTKP